MPPLELAARMLYWFFVYGLLGWCLEVMFAAVKERRLVNRGFLCGPICPIYGFGMVALLLAVRALGDPGGLGLYDFDMVASEAKLFLEEEGWC